MFVYRRGKLGGKGMDVRNCRTCGKLFNYMGSGKPICSACASELEEKFFQVREYVREHKNAGIKEVAEENEVTISQIKQWIREERLAFADNADIGIECEKCGTMIKTGRFCKTCKGNLASDLNGAVKRPISKQPEDERKNSTNTKGQARFLDRI